MAQQFTDHIFFQIALFERQSFLDRGQIGDVLAPTLSQGQDSQLHAGPPSCCTSDQTCQIVFAQRVSIQRARKKMRLSSAVKCSSVALISCSRPSSR